MTTDPFFLDAPQRLLACLQVACEDSPTGAGPSQFTLMAGEQVLVDAGPALDYCCMDSTGIGTGGLAVVRFAQSYPMGYGPFPQPDTGVEPCGATNYAMILEASIWRCYPSGDSAGNPPPLADINAFAVQELADVATLYRALCCFKTQQAQSKMGEATMGGIVSPVGPAGGCHGLAIQITTSVTGCTTCEG